MHEWMNESVVYIIKMEYYLAVKKMGRTGDHHAK
jgi:hypothetical protein